MLDKIELDEIGVLAEATRAAEKRMADRQLRVDIARGRLRDEERLLDEAREDAIKAHARLLDAVYGSSSPRVS